MTETVGFTAMKDGTKEDYALLERLEKPFLALTADRVLDEMRRAGEVTLEGYKVTRLQHGLQSGTRALRSGADIDWVVGGSRGCGRFCMMWAMGLPRKTMTRCPRKSSARSFGGRSPGPSNITGFSRCFTTVTTMAGTVTRATSSATIRCSTPVPRFASIGISRVSIPTIPWSRLKRSSPWCERFSGAKPMTQRSYATGSGRGCQRCWRPDA